MSLYDTDRMSSDELKKFITEANIIKKARLARAGIGLEFLINDRNPLIRSEVAKQGYGLDKLVSDKSLNVRNDAIIFLRKSGLNLSKWIELNPKKCVAGTAYKFSWKYPITSSTIKLMDVNQMLRDRQNKNRQEALTRMHVEKTALSTKIRSLERKPPLEATMKDAALRSGGDGNSKSVPTKDEPLI